MNTQAHHISYVNLVITLNDDGYLARCPGIQGAFAEGETIEDAIFNCLDVIKMIVDYRRERHEPLDIQITEFAPYSELMFAMPVGVN